jgi:hypothetical protein
VTALFTEHTGVHDPLALEWTVKASSPAFRPPSADLPVEPVAEAAPILAADEGRANAPTSSSIDAPTPASGVGVLEFAKALNRLDPAALELAAGPAPEAPVDGSEVRRLVGTFWFGAVFARLSASWRERLLDALVESVEVPNHVVRRGRQSVNLASATYAELKELDAKPVVGSAAASEVKLLVAIASLWGADALKRVQFVPVSEPESPSPSRLASLLGMRN